MKLPEFSDFLGAADDMMFAGSKRVVKKIMANNPLRQQLQMEKRALQQAKMQAKIQAKQAQRQQIQDTAMLPPFDPNLADPNAIYDPNLIDPTYDPNAEYYDPTVEYYEPATVPGGLPIPTVGGGAPAQNMLTQFTSPTEYSPTYYYGDHDMNSNFFAKGGKKSKKTTTINTRTGLGGKAVRGIIEEFNKNAAQIYQNQKEMKQIENEMRKTQDQADMQRAQLESTMSIAQSAIDVAANAGSAAGYDPLTDYLAIDGAQPSYVPQIVADDYNTLTEDDNFMEYDEYDDADDFDEYDDADDFDEYDDADDFDEYDDADDFDEYDDADDFDEYDDSDFDEYDDNSDFDEYDDADDFDEFLGAPSGRRRRVGGVNRANRQANRQARKANRQARKANRQANRFARKQDKQLNRKQKLLMQAGRKKNAQQKRLLKRQSQLLGQQKKVANRRNKLRKIMQTSPTIRNAVAQGESTCSLFNKLNACALPPSLWRWRDCGKKLAPRRRMVANKLNQLTFGDFEGVDDNAFDCSCNDCSCNGE